MGPLIHTAWTAGLKKKIKVFGPEALLDYWKKFLSSMQFDIKNREKNEGRIKLKKIVKIIPIKKKTFNLWKIKVKIDDKHSPDIKLDDSLPLRMRYPAIDEFVKNNFDFKG